MTLCAYKTFGNCPDGKKPAGIPMDSVCCVARIPDESKDAYLKMGYTILSEEDYTTYEVYSESLIAAWSTNKTQLMIEDDIIQPAMDFGHRAITRFAAGNVILGVTQAGKAAAVSLFLHKVEHFMRSGSLYAAIAEIDSLISDGLPSDLAPFITEDRMNDFKATIKTYLGIT